MHKVSSRANNIMVVDNADAIRYYHNETEGTLVRPACEPQYEIFNNVVCATSKASDQPAHTCSLIRAFASCLNSQVC